MALAPLHLQVHSVGRLLCPARDLQEISFLPETVLKALVTVTSR